MKPKDHGATAASLAGSNDLLVKLLGGVIIYTNNAASCFIQGDCDHPLQRDPGKRSEVADTVWQTVPPGRAEREQALDTGAETKNSEQASSALSWRSQGTLVPAGVYVFLTVYKLLVPGGAQARLNIPRLSQQSLRRNSWESLNV